MDAAEDFRSDTQLFDACKDDAVKVCPGVKNGGGRVQACLVRGGEGGAGLEVLLRSQCASHQPLVSLCNCACHSLPSACPPHAHALAFPPHCAPPLPLQRDKRMQLTWLCEEQLFRQEMEDSDDIRLR